MKAPSLSQLTQTQLKRLTSVHGWSGTILGLLLYAVVTTGTVAVFAHEIAAWSVSGVQSHTPLKLPLNDKVRAVTDRMTKGYLDEVTFWGNSRGNLMVFPHTHAHNSETGQVSNYGALFRLDAENGEILSRADGFVFNKPENYVVSALEDFLVDLHVQLYVPRPWGLILTGVLGLSMMAAGVTGLLMHRHVIRDLFVAARPGERLVTARDRHILAGTWGLVFAFILGFTGSFYSFAGTITFPLVSQVAFGGDREAMSDVLFEAKVAPDPRPVPLVDIDKVVADSLDRAGAPVSSVNIDRFGRADARIVVRHRAADGSLNGASHIYDGGSGAFLGSRPFLGQVPSTSGDLYSLIRPLHFGHFAGVLSKSVWVGLGAAMCYVILSGMRLWVRRREGERLWRGFGRAVTVTAYGLPFAMLAAGHGFFLAGVEGGDAFLWTPAGFLIGAALCIALGLLLPGEDDRLSRLFRGLLAVSCAALPMLRLATGGMGWLDAAAGGQGAVLSLDLTFLTLSGLLALWTLRVADKAAAQPIAEPAE